MVMLLVLLLLLLVVVLLFVVIPMNICWCCFCLRFSLHFVFCPPSSSSCSLVALLLTLGLLGSVFFFFYSIPFCTVLLFLCFSCSSFVLNIGGVVHTILGSFMVGRPIIAAVSQDAVAYWPAAQRRELTVCLFSTHYLDPLLFIFPSLSLPVCLVLSFLVALRMLLCVCICR